MASYPTGEKRDRLCHDDPQRSLIIQNALVPASEVGRAPVVRIPAPEALAFERMHELSLSADGYALGGGSPSPLSPTDLSYSQVNTTMLELYSNTSDSNSPTRKGGPSHHVPEMGVLTQYLLRAGLMSNVRHLLTITSNIRHCLQDT